MTDLQDHMKVGAPRYTAKQHERPRVSVPLCPSPRYVQQLVPCSVVWVLPPLFSITTYRGTQYDEFFLFSFLLSLLPMTKNREGSNVEWSKEARDRSRSKVRKVQSCPSPSLVDPSPLLFGGLSRRLRCRCITSRQEQNEKKEAKKKKKNTPLCLRGTT